MVLINNLKERMAIFIILSLIISCENIISVVDVEPMKDKNVIFDSLKTAGFRFTNEINYFNFDSTKEVIPTKDTYCFGIKRIGDSIEILKIRENRIIQHRLLKPYLENILIEEQEIDNTDGGVINYYTLYYFKSKIIVLSVTKDIFEKGEYSLYLENIIFIDEKSLIKYYYHYTDNLNRKTPYIYLTLNQLMNIETEAPSYFFNPKKVGKEEYLNKNFGKGETSFWNLFLLD